MKYKIEMLKKRLKNLIKLYNNGKYPVKVMILGFGNLKIDSREELLGRIRELAELTLTSYMPSTETIKNNDGSIIKNYRIKLI